MTLLEHALKYLSLGYSVIPVRSNRKGGSTVKWREFQTRRPTEQELTRWFGKPNGDTGIAIVTGAISGIVVLDFDRHGDEDGLEVAKAEHGFEVEGPAVATGGGGMHAYFKHPGGTVKNCVGLLPGVDLRGDGGFVYAPPSPHPSGRLYEWLFDPELETLPDLPAWVTQEGHKAPAQQQKTAGPMQSDAPDDLAALDPLEALLRDGASEGARNEAATRLAGRYIAQGLTAPATLALLQGWNVRNRPPLANAELAKVVESIATMEHVKQGGDIERTNGKIDSQDREAVIAALADRFRIPLTDIVRIAGSDPIYRFFCGDACADLPARDILSQWSWSRTMVAMTQRVPAQIAKKATPPWEYYLQLMMDVATQVEPGEEATDRGQLREWIAAYLDMGHVRAEDEKSAHPTETRVYQGKTFVHVPALRRFLGVEYGNAPSGKELTQRLSAEGFERQRIKFVVSERGATIRTFRGVPPQYLESE